MTPKARAVIANSAIVAAALIGGVVLTNHYTESAGGLGSAFGLTNTASSTTGTGSNSTGEQKATGEAFQYQFGTIQLEVVRTNGKLTAVNLVQATATNGREQAFSYLQQYAIQANGSNFGNLSGATYTVDTFKQALDSALSKLP